MSTSRGSSGGAGVQSIPAGSRKMVQSLKEIVSCTETEIYAALKDCNMDPNEAVNRLLSQGFFFSAKSLIFWKLFGVTLILVVCVVSYFGMWLRDFCWPLVERVSVVWGLVA